MLRYLSAPAHYYLRVAPDGFIPWHLLQDLLAGTEHGSQPEESLQSKPLGGLGQRAIGAFGNSEHEKSKPPMVLFYFLN